MRFSSQGEAASDHDDRPGHNRCETHACNPQSGEGALADCGSEDGGPDLGALLLKCRVARLRIHHGNPSAPPEKPLEVVAEAGSIEQAVGENIQQVRGGATTMTPRAVSS